MLYSPTLLIFYGHVLMFLINKIRKQIVQYRSEYIPNKSVEAQV